MNHSQSNVSRRQFLAGTSAVLLAGAAGMQSSLSASGRKKAQIAITFDLEMSRHYPRRGMLEWDYQKGNLDEATKQYALQAGTVARERGGVIHYFCVGRVLEQPQIDWLKKLSAAGHPIGNHTYDHVNLLAGSPTQTQFRFQRAPWLVTGEQTADVIRENIRITTAALKERADIQANGFRTPGGFANGLADREDLQTMLLDLGFTWVSSKYPPHSKGKPHEEPSADVYAGIVAAQKQAQPFVYPTGLIEIPMSPISDVTAFRSQFWEREWFLNAVRLAVEWAIDTGGVFDFLCHPSCMVVEDPEFETVKLICDLVRQAGDRAELVGLDRIAARLQMP